jgi:hypothetical protein
MWSVSVNVMKCKYEVWSVSVSVKEEVCRRVWSMSMKWWNVKLMKYECKEYEV